MIDYSGISRSKLAGWALRLPLRLVPKNTVAPILQGPLKGKRWITGSSTHGCWLGSYEAAVQRQITKVVRPGMVCWDVGANVGFYTLLFAELVGNSGRVFAFEPASRNIQFLRQHVKMNKFENIRIVPGALADFDGESSFDPGHEPSMGHLAPDGSFKVPCSRADTLLAAGEIEMPDVIKIDVEGAEAGVLRGAMRTLEQRPIIVLATHGNSVHRSCIDLLTRSGYEVGALNGGSLYDTDEVVAVAAGV